MEDSLRLTLDYIKQNSPKDFERLEASPKDKERIVNAIKATIKETEVLSDALKGKPDNIEETLAKHLSSERVTLIKKSLEIPTFRLDIKKTDVSKHHQAFFTRNNSQILEPRNLNSTLSIDWASVKQWASIVVEAIMLVMSAAGISISPGEHAIEQAVDEVAHVIQTSSKFERALEVFKQAWDSAGGSNWEKAKALFFLIKDSYSAGILWTVIKSLCSNMSRLDWLETAAKVSAMIIAALATDGAALIAEIALVVLSAVDFARKIANLNQLNALKLELGS